MSKKRVSILHPFTPKVAGVVEESVSLYHSQPHRKSLEMLAQRTDYVCSIEYFTGRLFSYESTLNGISTKFFPVSWKLNGDHRKWKKQASSTCLKVYGENSPEVTIINMSGNSSKFSYDLGNTILGEGKKYIAMLGGQHYTDLPWVRDYYRQAHHLLVHTHLQKERMQRMNMFKNLDIRVFPLGVDCDYFSPAINDRNEDIISLLYIGRIVEWKRVHLAIEVAKSLKMLGRPFVLRLVGPVASEAYYGHLKKLVIDFSLTKEVIFEGYKNHAEVRNLMRNANLLLLPSENETFGMVIVESMACGLPVAGVKGGHGPDEVIKDRVNGVLTTEDHFVDAVVQFLLGNREEIKLAKEAARETALSKYSIEETYKVLKRSVEDCLA
jgi:glycosyltransferase involved in cell wall biosynthesis